jgi:death-on-curing protein
VKLSAIFFMGADEINRLHSAALAISGGLDGVRDTGLMESAAAAPQKTAFGELAHPTLARMAAALAHALAKNHAFLDGNKRTAASAASLFLVLNGVRVRFSGPWEDAFVQLAEGGLTRSDIAVRIATEMGGDVDVEIDE